MLLKVGVTVPSSSKDALMALRTAICWVWLTVGLPVGGLSMTYPPTVMLLNTPTIPIINQFASLVAMSNITMNTVFDEVTTYPYEVDTIISWQGTAVAAAAGIHKSNITARANGGLFENESWNSTETITTTSNVGLLDIDVTESTRTESASDDGGLDWEMVSAPSRDVSTFQQVLLGVVLYTLSLLTLAGNTMVLHAIRTERRLQTVSLQLVHVCVFYIGSNT